MKLSKVPGNIPTPYELLVGGLAYDFATNSMYTKLQDGVIHQIELGTPAGVSIDERGGLLYDETISYVVGDIISETDIVYVCVTDTDVPSGVFDPLRWLKTDKEQGGVFYQKANYLVGDIITADVDNGVDPVFTDVYRCVNDYTSIGLTPVNFFNEIANWALTAEAGTGTAWGDITGTLANQIDLQDELDDRVLVAGDTMTGSLVLNNSTNDTPEITFQDETRNSMTSIDQQGEHFRVLTNYRGQGWKVNHFTDLQTGVTYYDEGNLVARGGHLVAGNEHGVYTGNGLVNGAYSQHNTKDNGYSYFGGQGNGALASYKTVHKTKLSTGVRTYDHTPYVKTSIPSLSDDFQLVHKKYVDDQYELITSSNGYALKYTNGVVMAYVSDTCTYDNSYELTFDWLMPVASLTGAHYASVSMSEVPLPSGSTANAYKVLSRVNSSTGTNTLFTLWTEGLWSAGDTVDITGFMIGQWK